jgi:4-diphosphocytidyl-2-C-methyl-D-erythritol kinase
LYNDFYAMRKVLRIGAPCKINLHLRVKGRRSDGYHDLESVFLALAFGDTLRIAVEEGIPGGMIRLDCASRPWIRLPGDFGSEKNLVHRAASLFRARTGFDRPLRIRLEKAVPLGGGLGGGSSDAASVLTALNELAGAALSGETLGAMAAELGSDVPFFLTGGAALVSGRGGEVRGIGAPGKVSVVLVNPGFSSGTAGAFRLLDAWRDGGGELPEGRPLEDLADALAGPPGRWPYGNDFLPAFLAAGSEEEKRAYKGILEDLRVLGADFSGLTGAGSTCFGVFTDADRAVRAVSSLSRGRNFVQLTFPLARSGNAVLE